MKKIIIASTFAFVLSSAQQTQALSPPEQTAKAPVAQSQSPNTKQRQNRNDLIGFGSGAVAGSLLGGPVGGVIGGIFGIFVANDVNQENKISLQDAALSSMGERLSEQEQSFVSLQHHYAQLEQSQMIHLASIDTKLAAEWMHDLPALESNVQFKTASFLVEDAFKGQLKSVAGLLNQYPNLTVHLNGFADARGNSQYNRILSEQRAQSVKDFLIVQRVKPAQIVAQGQGELNVTALALPAKATTVEVNKQLESLFFDRRVTLKLLNDRSQMTASN